MNKTSMPMIVTVVVIAAGTAFIAHSWMDRDNEGFLGGILGSTTRAAAVVADVPEKAITGEPMGTDTRPGVLGTPIEAVGNVGGRVADVPQNVVQGNYRADRRYNDLETEMVTDEEIFPTIDSEEVEIEEED